MTPQHLWWQRGIVYEVYVRSFADASGDGVGDLEGIRSRLDHLTWLGVDALWITPFFPSPMVDGGYDVANYTGVDVLAYRRRHGDRKLLVALNLGAADARLALPADFRRARVLLATIGSLEDRACTGELELPANAGMVLQPMGSTAG